MKKGLKISLIVIPIILLLGGGAFVGTLLYTKANVGYNVGEATVTSFILPSLPTYTGYIVVGVPLNLTNGGTYGIVDLSISLKVYGENFSISELDGILLGEGVNDVGTIKIGETWSGELEINMTLNIAILAIQDGDLRIEVDIFLRLNAGLFKMKFESSEIQSQPWDSPFGF